MTGLTFLLSTAIALVQSAAAVDSSAMSEARTAQSVPGETASEPGVPQTAAQEAVQETQTLERERQDRGATLSRIDAYFEALDTLQARFEQVAADTSVTTGTLYLDRPGRVRFDYDDPSPVLLVADGQTVAIADFDLETVDRAPIGQTPFKFLLEPDLDPQTSAAVEEVSRHGEEIYLTLVDPDGESEGRVTLIFSDPDPQGPAEDMRLGGWIAVDAMGGFTEVRLSEHQRDIRLAPRLFVLEDDPFDDRRRTRR